MSHRIALDNYSYRAQYDAAAGPFLAEFRGVSRFRPSARRWAASALALVFALMLGAGTARAQSATTFVKNTGQTAVSGSLIIGFSGANRWESGASFTTGGNPTGYTLSEVVVRVGGSASGASPQVSIYTTTSAGLPDSSLHVLNNPASLTVNALNTFTASAGATLAPNTTYAVVLQQTGTSGSWNVLRTASGDEDSGAASGWSIADQRAWRNAASTTTWSTTNEAVMISIRGTLGGYTGTPGSPGAPAAPAAPDARKRMLERTLAAVSSRTVAGALDNIGTRLDDAAPAAGLNLGGLNLAGPNPAGRHAPSGPDDVWPSGGGHGRGMTPDSLLGSGAFSLTLGATEREKGFDPLAPRWGIWGRGDFGTFAGRTSEGPGGGSSHDGDLRTGWLGADARGVRASGRWVAGLAVSRGTSRTDYVLDGEQGRIETDLTALWPYGRWTFPDGLEMRGLLGVGRGEARHGSGDGTEEKSDLSMWAASVGFSRPLPPMGGIGHGIDLAARGDASVAFMETEYGDGTVDGLSAAVSRVRGGVEASRRIAMADGAAITPFAELAGRMDGGDGVTGPGIEVAGGIRYAGPRVAVEVRGRWLAAHTEAGAKERGASLTARLDPGALGRGLSMSLAPRWGAGTGGADALWRDEMPGGAAGADPAGGFEGELGYGFGLGGGRFTGTPNVGFGASDGGGRDYRVGWRLTPAAGGYFEVNLDATRRESANGGAPANGAMLTGAMRW